MFNLKEIKKVFLATFLLIAMVVFTSPSYAQADCTGKSGYEALLCQEQAALAAKGAKSQNKIKEAQQKQNDVKKSNENKTSKQDKKAAEAKDKESEAALKLATVLNDTDGVAARGNAARESKAAAQKELTAALKSGDKDAAKAAQAKMVTANKDLDKVSSDVKNRNEAREEASKARGKAAEAEADAAAKAKKAEAKANKKVVNSAEKAEKKAESAAKKADKEVEKLQKKCEKNPEKCDMDALQVALAKQEAAKAAASGAKDQREELDGTAAKRKAAEDAKALEEADNALYEAGDCETIQTQAIKDKCLKVQLAGGKGAAGDTEADALNADKQGQAEAAAKPKRCAGLNSVFEIIACKAMTTLADLRQVVYLFAGFGLIAFAWGAIFNKISWKHFSQIAFALFLLSMMGSFIRYFSYDADRELMFGKYLQDDHEQTKAGVIDPEDCDEDLNKDSIFCTQMLAEFTVTAQKKKWSLKDLKGSVQAGIGAIQKANSAYKTAKATVENVVNQAQTIGNAIKNGEGGLTGVLSTMNAVATASGSIMNSGQLLANNLSANIGGMTEDIKNVNMTNKEREVRAKDKARLDTLTKMCDGGACDGDGSGAKKLRSEMQALKEKETTQDTKVNKWLKNDEKGGGATILAGVNKVGNISNAATNTIRSASDAAQNGATIAGGIGSGTGDALGAIFGLATVAGEVTSAGGNPNFDFKSAGTKRTEKAVADKAAFEKTSEYVASVKTVGNKTTEVRGDGSVKIVDSKTGTTTVTGGDGSVVTTTQGGSKVEVMTDGTKVVTNSNGKVTITTPDGKTTIDESNIKVKYSGDASIREQSKSTPTPATKAPATKAPATKAPATPTPATKAPATKDPKPQEVKKSEPKKEAAGDSKVSVPVAGKFSSSCPRDLKEECFWKGNVGSQCAPCKAENDKLQSADKKKAEAAEKAKKAEAEEKAKKAEAEEKAKKAEAEEKAKKAAMEKEKAELKIEEEYIKAREKRVAPARIARDEAFKKLQASGCRCNGYEHISCIYVCNAAREAEKNLTAKW